MCGLRSAEHALVAAEAGADLLGFIFAPSRRQVAPAEVARIAQAVRALPAANRPKLVGVFVNEAPERMRACARECGLDAVQLSGDEPLGFADELRDLALIKALRFDGSAEERRWIEAEQPHVRLLVDAHVPGAYGGAGVMADWPRAADLARQRPILLAGGLSPTNVVAAIAQVQPWGVDVSSGIESDGAKDPAKIRAFVAAMRPVV